MEGNREIVGIDVGKETVSVSGYGRSDKPITVTRDRKELEKLARKLAGSGVELVAMEASGGYERLVLETLYAGGVKVALVQPHRVRAYATAIGRRAKTDAIDSAVIASFAAAIQPEPWKPSDPRIEQARELSRYRDDLVQQRSAEKNRLQQANCARAEEFITEHIDYLAEQIKAVDEDIVALLESVPEVQAVSKRLQTVPGVGPVTAARIVTDLPEIGTLNRRRIASLVGLAPMNDDSGDHGGRRVISGGRRGPRTALYQAANSAKQHNPTIKAFYATLRSRGKPHVLALVACARKLLVILDAMIRNGTDWQPPTPSQEVASA